MILGQSPVTLRAITGGAICATALLATPARADDAPAPCTVTLYSGGPIITMDGDTPQTVEAVVVRDGKILLAGSAHAARRAAGRDACRYDLAGRTMLPGFIDAHSHFTYALTQAGGINVGSPPTGAVRDIPTLIATVRQRIADDHIAPGSWVVAWNYDQEQLAEQRHITRAELDAAFPDHKVVIMHASLHGAVYNGAALAAAGMTRDTPTPQGGVIGRDANGELNGLLMEAAMFAAAGQMPQPDAARRMTMLAAAQRAYFAEGYTHAQDGAAGARDIAFLTSPAARAQIRIDLSIEPIFTEVPALLAAGHLQFGRYYDHVKLQGAKFVLDGSPQGRTAYSTHVYRRGGPNGEHDWHGTPIMSTDAFVAAAQPLVAAGVQLFMHANGDGAIDLATTGLERMGFRAGDNRRPVMIHSQFQRPDQLPRYVALGVSPSYFSNHTYFWADTHRANFGPEIVSFISPLRSAQAAGLHVSNHTDYVVTPLDTRFMLWTSMARESRSGVVSGRAERLSAYAALQALTTGPAYQMREEARKGRIKSGMLADFVILDHNPLTTPVSEIRNMRVMATIKDGVVVYQNGQ